MTKSRFLTVYIRCTVLFHVAQHDARCFGVAQANLRGGRMVDLIYILYNVKTAVRRAVQCEISPVQRMCIVTKMIRPVKTLHKYYTRLVKPAATKTANLWHVLRP